MRSLKENEESICLWCGKPTNVENSNREHIFPATIGGKETLPLGSVCKECNSKLGFLDEFLKYGHEAMMFAFQTDSGITGRIRGKSDRARKARERTEITGKGEAKDTRISRKGSDMCVTNASFTVKSEDFVRALHKCTANVLCNFYGVKFVRENYEDILKFVRDGGDVRPWSYAVSFPDPTKGKRPLISEPKHLLFKSKSGNENVVSFIHTSGIWITGCQPFLLNPEVIETVSEFIAEKLEHVKEPDTKKSAIDFFGFNWDLSKNRAVIGRLKFLWIVKEVD